VLSKDWDLFNLKERFTEEVAQEAMTHPERKWQRKWKLYEPSLLSSKISRSVPLTCRQVCLIDAEDDQSGDVPSIEYAPSSRLKLRRFREGHPIARYQRLVERFRDRVLGDECGYTLLPDECR
jgi:hypothetical protein